MFWKSKPRAFNRCVIASPKAANFSLMPSHIPVMALRNSSLVSHKCLKAATNTATIATTASTGPATVPSALPREVIEPLLPAIFTPSFATPFVRDEKVFMVVPTVDMVLPRTMSRGPRAAATAMIFTTACFCASLIPFSLSTNAWIFSTALRTIGIRISPKEIARPSSADFNRVS